MFLGGAMGVAGARCERPILGIWLSSQGVGVMRAAPLVQTNRNASGLSCDRQRFEAQFGTSF